MSEFQTIIRRGFEVSAVGTAALVLASCGGDKPKPSGEFKDGMRIQRFHPTGSERFYSEIIQQCDGHTLVETTFDNGFHLKNRKKQYSVSVNTDTFENSPVCEDEQITPEDFQNPITPATIATNTVNA